MQDTAGIATIEDGELVLKWAIAQEAVRNQRDIAARIEVELQRRMEERKAKAIMDPYFDVRLETPQSLDPARLAPLAELVPPEEWSKGFVPAHEETIWVLSRADLRVVNGWRKFGAAIAAGIDAALVPGQPRVTIKPKRARPQ